MKHSNLIKTLPALVMLGLTACTSINVEEMDQLDAEGVRSILLGKTLTFTNDNGKFATYTKPDQLTGVARASGSWGAQKANSTHTVSENGELCTQYEAEYDWSTPEYEYCGIFYIDAEGSYYSKSTKNEKRPERVGRVRAFAIADGDKYNLMN